MPVHDWTRVEAGIFHAFHTAWIGEIQKGLNRGRLPSGYYALAEQHTGMSIADAIVLHDGRPSTNGVGPHSPVAGPAPSGPGPATAVLEAPPRVRRHSRFRYRPRLLSGPRTLAIRHISRHRLVALIEIVSPANKDRPEAVAALVDKVLAALDLRVNVLVVDVLPPGPSDPTGFHGALLAKLPPVSESPPSEPEEPDASEPAALVPPEAFALPPGEPLTVVGYMVGATPDAVGEAFLEHLAVGANLPAGPLFLAPSRYVEAPLEETYRAAAEGLPGYWRDVLEQQP